MILLPITQGIYDFRTDLREDNFTVATAVGCDNTTAQLFKAIYDDDTSTIDIASHDADDSPTFVSYNTTTRATVINGLADNTTRVLDVTYDVSAFTEGGLTAFIDLLPWLWILLWIAFPTAAIAAIWFGRS